MSTITIKEIGFEKPNDYKIELSFNHHQTFEIDISEPIPEANLEWYFEDYINEPYTANSKIEKSIKAVYSYGEDLFKQLFQNKDAYSLYKQMVDKEYHSGIQIEIIGKSGGFHSIYWETLKDENSQPLSVSGVNIYRKNINPVPISANVKKSAWLNLLIVTSRPFSNDAKYHTIQRPLIDIVDKAKIRIRPFILRPGTFTAFREHLQKVGEGYYHIIHFDMHGAVLDYDTLINSKNNGNMKFEFNAFNGNDFNLRDGAFELKEFEGKRAFLFFEDKKEGVAVPYDATEISDYMKTKRIPVCILNACQSAMQSKTSEEVSIGQKFIESGMQLVLAMRHSISITAAIKLMEETYNSIANNEQIEKAILFGRNKLFAQKRRDASFAQSIDLEDWLLPVVYQNQKVELNIEQEFETDEAEDKYNLSKKRKYISKNLKHGFFGRDLDILKIEKMLAIKENKNILIRGMLAVGKTTLFDYLGDWWTRTNFVENAIYFSFEEKQWELNQIIDKIAEVIFDEETFRKFKERIPATKEEKIIDALKNKTYALFFDNIGNVSKKNPNGNYPDEKLITFFSRIKNTYIIYGSRTSCELFQKETFQKNIYILNGFNKDTTYNFAKTIIEYEGLNFDNLLKKYEFDMKHILELLQGFPSAMEEILPMLKNYNPEKVLEYLQTGEIKE